MIIASKVPLVYYIHTPKMHAWKVLNALMPYHGTNVTNLISTLLVFYGVLSLLIIPVYRKLYKTVVSDL